MNQVGRLHYFFTPERFIAHSALEDQIPWPGRIIPWDCWWASRCAWICICLPQQLLLTGDLSFDWLHRFKPSVRITLVQNGPDALTIPLVKTLNLFFALHDPRSAWSSIIMAFAKIWNDNFHMSKFEGPVSSTLQAAACRLYQCCILTAWSFWPTYARTGPICWSRSMVGCHCQWDAWALKAVQPLAQILSEDFHPPCTKQSSACNMLPSPVLTSCHSLTHQLGTGLNSTWSFSVRPKRLHPLPAACLQEPSAPQQPEHPLSICSIDQPTLPFPAALR